MPAAPSNPRAASPRPLRPRFHSHVPHRHPSAPSGFVRIPDALSGSVRLSDAARDVYGGGAPGAGAPGAFSGWSRIA
jgi:hypothetical protein